jgi:hypothetical protein
MAMTKAQLEAWLEGWRLVEAVQRVEAAPNPSICLAQVMPLCDAMRKGLLPGERTPADEESVRRVWGRLTEAWLRA